MVIAGLVGTGWRWAAVFGTIWLILVNGISSSVFLYHLARPENAHDFGFYVVLLGLSAVGIVAGAAAAARPDLRPGWLPLFLTGVTMLCLGAITVVAIPRPSATARISPAALAGLPALSTSNFAFDQSELHARAGETVALRLINHDTATHAFAIDALDVDVPIHSGETGLALFRPTAPGNYTFYCSVPHHEDMRGTLIVETI
jgi:heme/copper-type cytochrome/quinol oxidase subunit 2